MPAARVQEEQTIERERRHRSTGYYIDRRARSGSSTQYRLARHIATYRTDTHDPLSCRFALPCGLCSRPRLQLAAAIELPGRSRADPPRTGAARQGLDSEALRHGPARADAAREDRHVDRRVARVQRRSRCFDRWRRCTTYSSRRRTILVFNDRGGTVERLSIGRFDYDGLYHGRADGATTNSGTACASWSTSAIRRSIGINTSEAWNHADGLTANEKEQLLKALGPAVRRARQVGRDAGRRLARSEAAGRDRGLPPRDEGRAPGHRRGVLEQGHRTRHDDERGPRLVDAAARRQHGPRPVVPSVDHHSPQGRHSAGHRRRRRASFSAATCSTPTSASSISASPPTRSTTRTSCCLARPTRPPA